MDDGEGVNERAGSGLKTVVNCDSLRDAIRNSPSNSIPQAVTINNSLRSFVRF